MESDARRMLSMASGVLPPRRHAMALSADFAVSTRTNLIQLVRTRSVMPKKPKHNYDESKVKTLSSLEHIRLRTGMYIGRIGNGAHYDDGCYILLKEVIDNAIDEYIMGFGKEIELTIDGSRVSVRDFGRGIPLGKVVDC